MFVRLLHGAVALSLASEPAAAPDAADAPDDPVESASPADEPASPDAETPATESPAADPPAADPASAAAPPTDVADETDAPATENAAPEAEETSPGQDEAAEVEAQAATPPPTATEAPRPVRGPPPSGRDNDIVRKALLGGGIASLTLTVGLIGASTWAWTERSQSERELSDLTGQERVDAQDRRDQMQTIGVVTTAAAALYGTTGVVLLLLNARDRKRTRNTVLAPNPGGLSLVGRF